MRIPLGSIERAADQHGRLAALAVRIAAALGGGFFAQPDRHDWRDGKSSALIDGLVRDNLPRVAAWTIASLLLAYMLAQTL